MGRCPPIAPGAAAWRLVVAVLVLVSAAGCRSGSYPELDARLADATEPYRFSALAWETRHLLGGALAALPLVERANPVVGASGDRDTIEAYLALTREIAHARSLVTRSAATGDGAEAERREAELEALLRRREPLRRDVERILARQIAEAAAEAGIRTPADRRAALPVTFPPVWFVLASPPHSLIVSPRERIETVREVLLVDGLAVEEMERIEAASEGPDHSALVVALGGFGGLYPALVADTSSLSFLVEAATEEWFHQYLAFTPLGYRYVVHLLGVRRDYPIVTMNETVAGMVSEELARAVLVRYYPEHVPPERDGREEPPEGAFSFHREMRETRLRVDELLAQGGIVEAEEYMEERRQFLAANGYHIRKLNQAYFAFHGAYADEPTAVDPIGDQMRALRAQSASLQEFVRRAVVLTSPEALEERVRDGRERAEAAR